ncbi:uncharacterized protein LOC111470737 isoform X1 [Cucurbita maxima]|uniref:Uncharacterized protein LOC111470737 isoform X1 n=2 Tax=Cucurbita maxima TaxID=3661 RepID=A0A6J1I516_CUCMA|nr:uncharacterized protein LOC111470737 isoform X1 [Cucurbita maxima]
METTPTLCSFPPYPFTPHRHYRQLRCRIYSPEPRQLFTTLSCFKPRRRPRQKNKLAKFHTIQSPLESSSDSKLQTVIEIDQFTAEASSLVYFVYYYSRSQFRQFLSSGLDAFHDLRTLIAFDDQNRTLTVSCRRSTVEFLGQLVLFSFVVVFLVRVLIGIGSRFRNQFSYGYTSPVVRRDRSLGGREVVVGTVRDKAVAKKNNHFGILDSPLSMTSMALTDVSDEVSRNGAWVGDRLPKWWPPAVPRRISTANRQEYQIEADRLVRALVDSRMSGRDFMEDDILHLRQICRMSGVKVSFNTENMRDSFYRASVDSVFNIYSRTPINPNSVLINGENGPSFLAGLAEDIGIQNTRAARIISAAVAARMRSCFLQAWALVMQDRHSEADAELLKMCHIVQIFPPDESSPEMEMLTLGLKKHLKVEQRECLMNMFISVCGKDSHKTAAEALGLVCWSPHCCSSCFVGAQTG